MEFLRRLRNRLDLKFVLIVAATAVATVLTCMALSDIRRRSDVMVGPTGMDRFSHYRKVESELIRNLGVTNFASCEQRRELLHEMIEDSSIPPRQREERAVYLIASLILDGSQCGPEVLKLAGSSVQLPTLRFYRQFRVTELYGNHLDQLLSDETGLALWMLSAMDPEALIPPPTLHCDCEIPRDESNEMLIALWSERFKHRGHASGP